MKFKDRNLPHTQTNMMAYYFASRDRNIWICNHIQEIKTVKKRLANKKPFFLSWRPIEKCVWGLPPCQPAKTYNMELISYTNYVSGHTMDLNGHFSSLNVPCLQFGFSFAYLKKKCKRFKWRLQKYMETRKFSCLQNCLFLNDEYLTFGYKRRNSLKS